MAIPNVARPRRRPAHELAGRLALLAAGACVLVALLPTAAWAWTPGTHVFLGEAILRALDGLPEATAALLRAFPYDFLYGSIAADTSVAKKYAPAGRHCHAWHVGEEILERAHDEPLRAFALGYLAHLAADTVAHNYFVPHQLAITSSTSGFGHSYWESRIDTHIGERWPRRAREVVLIDHTRSDEHLDRILSPTIFSTSTNRRIFRGMVYVTDTESWQRIYRLVSENSRWDLPDASVGRYLERAYDYVRDFLMRADASEPYRLDPSGDEPLRLAKRIRREALRAGGETLVRDEAEKRFGMPVSSLEYARTLPEPLFERTAGGGAER